MIQTLFHDHPASVGESYAQHFAKAMSFGLRLVAGGLACCVHALLPALFARSGSDTVLGLTHELRARRIRSESGGFILDYQI